MIVITKLPKEIFRMSKSSPFITMKRQVLEHRQNHVPQLLLCSSACCPADGYGQIFIRPSGTKSTFGPTTGAQASCLLSALEMYQPPAIKKPFA